MMISSMLQGFGRSVVGPQACPAACTRVHILGTNHTVAHRPACAASRTGVEQSREAGGNEWHSTPPACLCAQNTSLNEYAGMFVTLGRPDPPVA